MEISRPHLYFNFFFLSKMTLARSLSVDFLRTSFCFTIAIPGWLTRHSTAIWSQPPDALDRQIYRVPQILKILITENLLLTSFWGSRY